MPRRRCTLTTCYWRSEQLMTSQQRSSVLRALDRRRFIQVSAGSLAFAASGCGRGKERAESRGSTVIVGVPDEDVLNPSNPDREGAQFLAFLPLLALNEKGDLEGRLAERWEHSSDYREWTYYLRPGVRWHDGAPVTAHDVKFTLELLTHPDVLEISPGSIESVTVPNDHTVRVRHRRITDYAVNNVTYPKHLLEHLDPKQLYDWDFWQHPVGDGPYRFVRYQPQTMIAFEANPDYYRGKPRIERVLLKFVGRAGLADLLAGDLDAIRTVNPSWVLSLAADERFHLYTSGSPNYAAIIWQHRHPFFGDPRVRRALTLAIDRRELLRLLHFPENAPLTEGPLRREFPRAELAEPLPHDPAQARELFEAAGWHDRNGDGVREWQGLAFRFTALVNSSPHFHKVALYVQSQLREAGVEMAVQVDEGVRGRIRRGQLKEAAFDFISPSNQFNYITGANYLGYQNAEVAGLVNRARATLDPAVEDRIYGELAKILREDVPVTYLAPTMVTPVVASRIRGLRSPYRAELLRYMGELSLDEPDD